MASNFLGGGSIPQRTSIISSNELIAREGVELHKGMNFRDGAEGISVFLVLQHEDGYKDAWDEKTQTFIFEGHDSTTVEEGKSQDQLLMYSSGRVTDNGKFYKAAHAYVDGIRKEPLQVQVYEKLDAGIWFDKGIFNLVDAKGVEEGGRKVYKFHLVSSYPELRGEDWEERILPTGVKEEVWKRDGGRCAQCGSELDIHFAGRGTNTEDIRLLCADHSGRSTGGGMLG